jgi:hypothetical protein
MEGTAVKKSTRKNTAAYTVYTYILTYCLSGMNALLAEFVAAVQQDGSWVMVSQPAIYIQCCTVGIKIINGEGYIE